MRKVTKIIISTLSGVILALILLPVLLSLLLGTRRGQEMVKSEAEAWLSNKLETKVSVDRLSLRLFNKATLEGVYIEDYQGDTLFYASSVVVPVKRIGLRKGAPIRLGEVMLDKPVLKIVQDSTGTSNLRQILTRISRDKNDEGAEKKKSGLKITADGCRIVSMSFERRKFERREKQYGINFTDIAVNDFSLRLKDISVAGDSINTVIKSLTLKEKSGFKIDDLTASGAVVHPEGIFLRDLHIVLPESELNTDNFSMITGDWKGYNDFTDNVRFEANFRNSTISFSSIAFFAQSLRDWETTLEDVDLRVEGAVAALQGSIENVRSENTRLIADFSIDGLPYIDNTRFHLNLRSLTTNPGDADRLISDITGKRQEGIMKWVERVGPSEVSGRFDGLLSNFRADAKVISSLGTANLNLSLSASGEKGRAFKGHLSAADFDAGTLVRNKQLGKVTVFADINGNLGPQFRGEGKISVPALRFNGYTYRDLSMEGSFDRQSLRGVALGADPNILFRLEAEAEYPKAADGAERAPSYKADLALEACDLYKLNFDRRDSVSFIRAELKAEGTGRNLDDLNGKAVLDNIFFYNGIDTVNTGKVELIARNGESEKFLAAYSSFADVEFKGVQSYRDMFYYLNNRLSQYLPSASFRRPSPSGSAIPREIAAPDNFFMLSARVKEVDNIVGMFLPGLEIASGAKLDFMFSPSGDLFSLLLEAEYIQRGDKLFVSGLDINGRNQGDSLVIYARGEHLFVSGMYLTAFSVVGGAKNNVMKLAAGFNNPQRGASGLLNFSSMLIQNPASGIPQLKVDILPSYIDSEQTRWTVDAGEIVYDSTRLYVDGFCLRNGTQSFEIDGVASRSREDSISIKFNNFELAPLSGIFSRRPYELNGLTNGRIDISSALENPVIYAGVRFDSVMVNDVRVVDTRLESDWDFNKEQGDFSVSEQKTGRKIIEGFFRPGDKFLWAKAGIRRIDMSLLDPLLSGAIRGSSGTAVVRDMEFSSKAGDVSLKGEIALQDFATTVDYTNVPYRIPKGRIRAEGMKLILEQSEILDPDNRPGRIGGWVDLTNLRDVGFDLDIHCDEMQVLGTTYQHNEAFHGDIYASGGARIYGGGGNLAIMADMTTAGQSSLFIPLDDGGDIARADFIVFESPDVEVRQEQDAATLRREALLQRQERGRSRKSKLEVDLQVNVRPNTDVHLIMDRRTGEQIKGSGNGNLRINVVPSEDLFTMYGDCNISQGSYNFIFRNFVRRDFIIEPGSTIQFTGDPSDARLNASASYHLKTSLAPLIGGEDRSYSRSTPVECVLKMTGDLSSPVFDFDIRVPNANPEVQNRVAHALNSPEALINQFSYLVAFKSFFSDNSALDQNLNIAVQGATATGIDFLAGQIGGMISNDRFSFVPKYNVRNDYASSEWGGSFYGELIKDRLILDVDLMYDTGDNVQMNNRTANSLTGDASLSLLLDREGDFRVQAFSRTIDRYDEYQGLQESGVGIFYREYFDTFKELTEIFRKRFSGKGK